MRPYHTRLDMIRELPEGSVGAEIGVYRGSFSREILNLTNVAMLYLVDPWKQYAGYNDTINNENQDANYEQALDKVRADIGKNRCHVVRDFSANAAKFRTDVPPLDFCVIDAYHAYEAALEDITLWSARVKPGGCLLCHDYFSDVRRGQEGHTWTSGVPQAVEKFNAEHGWEIVGMTTGDDLPTVKLMKKP